MTIIRKKWTTEAGFPALVLFVNNSHNCGYVGFEKNHWVYGLNYDHFMDINVHGGLTFSSDIDIGDHGLWYLGFDCSHHGDKTPYNSIGIERTVEFCVNECENLAKQIKELTGTSFEYYCTASKNKSKLPDYLHNKMIALSLVKNSYAIQYFDLLKEMGE